MSASTGSLRECRFLDNDLQSLAHLAARLWLRGTKKDAPAAGGAGAKETGLAGDQLARFAARPFKF